MMFDKTSRYAVLEDAVYEMPDGHHITYKRRRFLPQGEVLPLLVEATVAPADRLDLITARLLGDPQQFWQICDANNAMNPFDWGQETGQRLRVPVPQFQEPR